MKKDCLIHTLLMVGLTVVSMTGDASELPGWPRRTTDKVLSSPCLADLDNDGTKEIITVSNDSRLYIWNDDGTSFTISNNTFPRPIGFSDGTIGSVAVGDVTGDSKPDIVMGGDDVSSQNAKVCLFDLDGFTTTTLALTNTSASFKSTIALIDCQAFYGGTEHPGLEMVFRDGDGKVYVYAMNSGSLSLLSSWDTVSATSDKDRYGCMPITPSVAAVYWDTTSTKTETLLVAPSTDGKIHYRKTTSSTYTDWSIDTDTTYDVGDWFLSSPAVGDLDDDNKLEVIVGNNDGHLYVLELNSQLTMSEDWVTTLGGWVISSPAVADIDNNGDLEVVVGCDDDKVYAFHHDGTSVTGWPKTTQGDVFASPAVAELDGESGLEIVVPSLDRRIYAWHANGSSLTNWPKKLDTLIFGSPAIGDLKGNGRFAIVVPSYSGKITLWELTPMTSDLWERWFQFRAGPARTGGF